MTFTLTLKVKRISLRCISDFSLSTRSNNLFVYLISAEAAIEWAKSCADMVPFDLKS